jgi:hypothetical protein
VTCCCFIRFSILLVSALAILFPSNTEGQTAPEPAPTAAGADASPAQAKGTDAASDSSQSKQPEPPQPEPQSPQSQGEKAERELNQQKKQRKLFPNFYTTDVQNAAPLTPKQKFHLALRSSVDPFKFITAGFDAGIGQAQNSFRGYGQGAQGYGKRYGAAYADQFSGTFWGSAVFPVLLHEDPRYFRKGTGGFKSRFFYAIATAVREKRDNGRWGPNYANALGNLTAGGLSNLYYPSTDRGVGLTFERAFTVTAEGAIGALVSEFSPDISKRIFHKRNKPKPPEPAPK